MIEALVIAVITVSTIGAGTSTLGPHQEAKPAIVAVLGDNGQVLYYNTK